MSNDDPTPRTSDTLSPQKQPATYTGVSIAFAHLQAYMAAISRSAPDAESEYQRALSRLREEPERAAVEIAAAYGGCDVRNYPSRWSLVFAASELRHEALMPFLTHVVDTPLPPEPREPSHGFSIVTEETILRTTAIEALGHLAANGNSDAVEALLRFLKQPSISIRRASVEALRSTKHYKKLVERVRAELPPDLHFLLKLEHPRVHEVKQVSDPKRFLSSEASMAPRDPAPPLRSPSSKRREPPKR